jgi:hypothetical protein
LAKYGLRTRPKNRIVETKSLKQYVYCFRDRSMFQEETVGQFLRDFVIDIKPVCVKVEGHFNTRGGIREVIEAEWAKGQILHSFDGKFSFTVFGNACWTLARDSKEIARDSEWVSSESTFGG